MWYILSKILIVCLENTKDNVTFLIKLYFLPEPWPGGPGGPGGPRSPVAPGLPIPGDPGGP